MGQDKLPWTACRQPLLASIRNYTTKKTAEFDWNFV